MLHTQPLYLHSPGTGCKTRERLLEPHPATPPAPLPTAAPLAHPDPTAMLEPQHHHWNPMRMRDMICNRCVHLYQCQTYMILHLFIPMYAPACPLERKEQMLPPMWPPPDQAPTAPPAPPAPLTPLTPLTPPEATQQGYCPLDLDLREHKMLLPTPAPPAPQEPTALLDHQQHWNPRRTMAMDMNYNRCVH